MDTERRPRADFSGIIAGINRVASGQAAMVDASMQPTLDPQMFSGLERGQQALAAGIVNVGGVIQKFAEKRQDAINQHDIGKARVAMQAEYMTHLAERDKANPRGWNDDWAKRADGYRQRVMADKNLSPYAREEILSSLDQFNLTTSARLLLESSEVLHKETGDMLFAEREQARRDKNPAGVQEATAKLVANRNISPGEGARLLMEDADQDKAEKQANLIALDPRLVIAQLKLPENERVEELKGLSPAEIQKTEALAGASMQRNKASVLQRVQLDRDSGKLNHANQWANPQIRAQYDPTRALSDDEVLEVMDSFGKPFDPMTFEIFHRRIAEYDAAKDSSGLERASIESQIALKMQGFPSYAKELADQLGARVAKSQAGDDAFDGEFKAALGEVDSSMKSGKFGVWEVPADRISWDEKQSSWVRQREEWEGPGEPVRITVSQEDSRALRAKSAKDGALIADLSTKDAAAQQAAMIRRTLEKGRASGLYKTPEDMSKAFRGMMGAATINEARGQLGEPAILPTEGDMPSMQQGASIDPNLFDTIFNQTR